MRVKASATQVLSHFWFSRLPVSAPPHAAKQGIVVLLFCHVIFTIQEHQNVCQEHFSDTQLIDSACRRRSQLTCRFGDFVGKKNSTNPLLSDACPGASSFLFFFVLFIALVSVVNMIFNAEVHSSSGREGKMCLLSSKWASLRHFSGRTHEPRGGSTGYCAGFPSCWQ